jgi:hypothetical protein
MKNVGEAEINVSRVLYIIVTQQIEFYLTLWVRLALSTLVLGIEKLILSRECGILLV